MRQIVLFLAVSGVVFGQSMLEAGAVMAGTTVGSAAGKKVSEGIDSKLKKTSSLLDTASKTGAKQTKAVSSTNTMPFLQVGAGVPKAEVNNVPPPPPLKRRTPVRPTPMRAVSVPIVMSAVLPEKPTPPVNVDLAGISRGMTREEVLALGNPSARITMFDDTHLVEIYQYRNQTNASGTVRLWDGAVSAVEARN